jgi:hypothetical protein
MEGTEMACSSEKPWQEPHCLGIHLTNMTSNLLTLYLLAGTADTQNKIVREHKETTHTPLPPTWT